MPNQSHFISRTLRADSDVHALFAVAPSRKALLFIHGYSGRALTTWSNFPDLLPQSKKFAGYDLYFYGYDGLRSPVNASAGLFRQLLDKMFLETAAFVNDNLPPANHRDLIFEYDEVVIVAHSLGAVVTRKALLDATRAKLPWAPKVKMVLFAPAHKGANFGNLALEAVSTVPFLRWFSGAARIFSPLIDELDPKKSDLLAKLEKATLDLCKGGKNKHLIARKVIWAQRDNVVIVDDFGNDPFGHPIKGTTHTSVCKPKAGFHEPFIYLEECL